MSTTASGFFYPATSYTSGIFQALKDAADSQETVIGARAIYTFRPADTAALAALSSSYTLRAGDLALQVDTGVLYRYNGTAWKAWAEASRRIIPTATVTAGAVSVGSTGIVTVTGSGANLVLQYATTDFDDYLIEYDLTAGTSANLSVNLCTGAGTADATASSYTLTQAEWNASAVLTSSVPAATTTWNGLRIGTNGGKGELKVMAPNLARKTYFHGWSFDEDFFRRNVDGAHTVTTAFPGIRFNPSSGVLTGTFRITGFTK